MIRRFFRKLNPTVIDLAVGIIIYGIILEVIGILLVEERGKYTLGLIFGITVALGLMFHMYKTLDKALDMDESSASKYITSMSVLRAIVMLVAGGIGIYLEQVSFVSVILGILGLKISAFVQPVINQYITIKLKEERG